MATANILGNGLSGISGSGSFAGTTSPTFVTPVLGTPTSGTLTNCTGLPIAGTTGYGTGVATALAANVNGSGAITLTTSPVFVTPTLGAATATSLTFSPTTGGIVGTTTNDNAGAGKVGEIISSTVAFASAISITTTVSKNLTSISLTAGDWDVYGNIYVTGTLVSYLLVWISTTSATQPDNSLVAAYLGAVAGDGAMAGPAPYFRASLSGTTTVYLSANSQFTGSGTICGAMYARRVR